MLCLLSLLQLLLLLPSLSRAASFEMTNFSRWSEGECQGGLYRIFYLALPTYVNRSFYQQALAELSEAGCERVQGEVLKMLKVPDCSDEGRTRLLRYVLDHLGMVHRLRLILGTLGLWDREMECRVMDFDVGHWLEIQERWELIRLRSAQSEDERQRILTEYFAPRALHLYRDLMDLK